MKWTSSLKTTNNQNSLKMNGDNWNEPNSINGTEFVIKTSKNPDQA